MKFALTSFVCLCFTLSARAWFAEGHMVGAQIAYNHLTKTVKARCDSLISVPLANSSAETSNFVTAAVWADDFKPQLGTASWHFIHLPISLDGTPTNGFVPPAFDIVQAINLNISILQNSNSVATKQATALRYLLHCVGDIHLPVHCVTAIWNVRPNGDDGGDTFFLGGGWGNLHALWDSGGGYLTNVISRPLTPGGQAALDAKVAVIESNYPYNPNAGALPTPMDWAVEGRGLAQTVAYVGITINTEPSAGYLNSAQGTAEQRLAVAGHRLADLLNTLFAPPFALTSVAVVDGKVRFSWTAVSNSTYRVQWKPQVGGTSWNDLTTITASSNSVSFSESLTSTQRFYRVVQ